MIKLDNNWYIDPTGNTATLVWEQEGGINEKTGKPTIRRDVYYYSTVKQALAGYTNRSLIHSESISEILEKIQEVEQTINNLKIN